MKLKIRTLIRNIGILLLLPLNFFFVGACLYFETLTWEPFWVVYFVLHIPLLGIAMLTLNLVLWVLQKIKTKGIINE